MLTHRHPRSGAHARSTVRLILWLPVLLLGAQPVQATFSIVAVDTVTGVVGSAGASCIDNAQIIEGVVENLGAINTQAFWNPQNQARADSLLRAGDTPDSIISYMVQNDAQNDGLDQSDRQYGAVTIAGPGSSAAHTGSGNSFWAGHRTGPGYSIQGNILLDSTIVELMEAAYLSTPGPLEDRLMAALEAAKVQGADIRCFGLGKSSISAYIKVVHPGDGGQFYLYEVVSNTTASVDPIDVLRDQFNAWKDAQIADPNLSTVSVTPAALPSTGVDTAQVLISPLNGNGLPPSKGALVTVTNTGGGVVSAAGDNGDGTFSASLQSAPTPGSDTLRAFVDAGGEVVELNQVALMTYFLCGDVNVDAVVTAADIIYMVNHVFKSGAAPLPVPASGDVNRSGALDAADIIALVGFVFKSGSPPCS